MMAADARGTGEGAEAIAAARALSSCAALLARAAGRALAEWDMTWPQAMSLLLLRATDGPINATRLVEQLATLQQTTEGLKGSVEEVTEDLPGSSGTGVIARARDAIGGQSG